MAFDFETRTNIMIAYDFDGVLIPDFNRVPNLGGLDEFYTMTQSVKPIFKPKGTWYIITGRDRSYLTQTASYIDKHFDNPPVALYQDRKRKEQKAWEYKAQILNELPEIQYYIESDPRTVSYLKEHVTTGCKVIHFADYLETSLSK